MQPERSLLEHVSDDLIWKIVGAVITILGVVAGTFISIFQKRIGDDVEKNTVAIEELRRDQAEFKHHVAEEYIQRQTMDTHVVEPLRRIEKMLMDHIVQNGKG